MLDNFIQLSIGLSGLMKYVECNAEWPRLENWPILCYWEKRFGFQRTFHEDVSLFHCVQCISNARISMNKMKPIKGLLLDHYWIHSSKWRSQFFFYSFKQNCGELLMHPWHFYCIFFKAQHLLDVKFCNFIGQVSHGTMF